MKKIAMSEVYLKAASFLLTKLVPIKLESVQHGPLIVWKCISIYGTSILHILKGNINVEKV